MTDEERKAAEAGIDFDEWRHWFEVALSGVAVDVMKTSVEADGIDSARAMVDRADAVARLAVAKVRERTPATREWSRPIPGGPR